MRPVGDALQPADMTPRHFHQKRPLATADVDLDWRAAREGGVEIDGRKVIGEDQLAHARAAAQAKTMVR